MTAADVIKRELSTVAGFDTTATWAERILKALKRGGYAVVELPAHSGEFKHQEVHGLRWRTPCYSIEVISGLSGDDNGILIGGMGPSSPDDAREFAAAVLAAADAAEVQS